ncbi:MAG: C39 family peptidase [Verrucomicrobiota bacterium]|nr:C39 family peptidase [Verrucomicrobiota bacterium]
MKQTILICSLACVAALANARTWTNTNGRTVAAEVVKVNPNKTVVLKTGRGKTVTVPFGTFVAEDVRHLEYLLSRKGRGKLHAVPWNELNELFGLEIWQDDLLWDDSTAQAADRMRLKKESKTDFMENHRAYPLGKEKVLSEPVYTTVLYGGREHAHSISFVFLNQGDMPVSSGHISPGIIEEMAERIEASGMRVHDVLIPALGEPKRDTLGKGDMREKVWRWDWNGHAIMLSMQEGKYAALRIMPTARADRAGRVGKIKEGELKKRLASCVERRDNGDVIIRNIPMVDQGPKGYCSPATWERYLRYMDIPADMYLLALAGNTGVGGGTYANEMIDATGSLISANGREFEGISGSLAPESVAEYIDMGLPIMWHFTSTPDFQMKANVNTAERNGIEVKDKDRIPTGGIGGHICLIIGYNKKTGEIAISDSWGSKYSERWVKAHEAQLVSRGYMNVIKW